MARMNPWKVALLRAGFRARLAVSEAWAFRVAHRLFTTPRRHPAPAEERGGMGGARRVELAFEGGRIAAWVWGDSGPRVVLLHGWEGRSSQWHRVAARLRGRGFQVFAVDPPAHGSSLGWRRANLPLFSRTLLRLETEFGAFACAVGHSMGGAAIVRALALGFAPGRAVIVSAPSRPKDYWTQMLVALGLPAGRIPAFDRRFERAYSFRWEEMDLAVRARERGEEVLFIHDRQDKEVAFREAEGMAAAWRGARLLPTEGLGHRRILADPAVAEAIADFAGAAEGPGQAA